MLTGLIVSGCNSPASRAFKAPRGASVTADTADTRDGAPALGAAEGAMYRVRSSKPPACEARGRLARCIAVKES